MWLVTLKGLLTHKLRLAMTSLAIVLGIAFVSGTFIYTDTIGDVFDDLVGSGFEGVDVFVRGESAFANIGTGQTEERQTIPEGVVDDVLALDEVADAAGLVEGYAQIVAPDGEAITTMGSPTLGMSWITPDLSATGLAPGGRAPAGPTEVAVDANSAEAHGIAVGDRVEVLFARIPPREFEVVGILTYGEGNNLAGATLAAFDLHTAQDVLGHEGELTSISVAGADGSSPEEVRDAVAAVLPVGTEAVTADTYAAEVSAAIEDALGFLDVALGIFAAVALFVGAFIIANTFTIVVAQRSREYALLRALGASRRQVLVSVLGEAGLLGLVSSAVGVVAGIGLAAGLRAIFDAVGVGLPDQGLVLAPRTVVVGLVLGTAMTLVASMLAARRASRVEPIAAMREAAAPPLPASRPRTVVSAVVLVAGIGALALAVGTDAGATGTLVGVGAVGILLGVGGLAPLVARRAARVLGAPGAAVGVPGQLARSNAARTPRRTSATAAALMIGLALVSFVAVFAASIEASATASLASHLRADYVITSTNALTGGMFSPMVAEQVRALPELDAVAELRMGQMAVPRPASDDGDAADGPSLAVVTGLDPEAWDGVADTEVVTGDLADLSLPDTVAVDTMVADELGLAVGDTVDVEFAATGEQAVHVVAVFEGNALVNGWLLGNDAYDAHFADPLSAVVLVTGRGDLPATDVRAAVERVTDAFPNVAVRDQAEYRQEVAGQVDAMLALVTALLAMALVIAVLGITNTLGLSVHERTREIGLARAVGATRRQVRSMIRWEAVIVALLGSVLGLALGVVFAWATAAALEDMGINEFVVPGARLALYAVLAVVVAVIAAILPARRAARLDVLRAVTVE